MDALLRYTREPRWRPRGQLWRYEVPPALREWLLDTSSLTRRLRARCSGELCVRMLGQALRNPSPDERRALGLRPGRRALVREVYLCCGPTPWVFARTVIPVNSLTGRGRGLARLGTRPLGELLFSDPHMQRGDPEVATLDPGHRLHALATGGVPGNGAVWGRRSRFLIAGKPLLVSEFFLPAFMAAMEVRNDAD